MNRLRIVPFVAVIRILSAGAYCSDHPAGIDSMVEVLEILVKGIE
jgi:hypothetical protein